jgi:hypothetical protein
MIASSLPPSPLIERVMCGLAADAKSANQDSRLLITCSVSSRCGLFHWHQFKRDENKLQAPLKPLIYTDFSPV